MEEATISGAIGNFLHALDQFETWKRFGFMLVIAVPMLLLQRLLSSIWQRVRGRNEQG